MFAAGNVKSVGGEVASDVGPGDSALGHGKPVVTVVTSDYTF